MNRTVDDAISTIPPSATGNDDDQPCHQPSHVITMAKKRNQQGRHLVDGQPGEFGGGQGAAARAAEDHGVVQVQGVQRDCGPPGLFAAIIGEVDIGRAGVFAITGPFGFAMTEQDQPVVADTHAHRFCLNLTGWRP